MPKVYEDDRIYFIDPSCVRRIVDDESERITTELIPTADPEKYVYRVTYSTPKFIIKRAEIK